MLPKPDKSKRQPTARRETSGRAALDPTYGSAHCAVLGRAALDPAYGCPSPNPAAAGWARASHGGSPATARTVSITRTGTPRSSICGEDHSEARSQGKRSRSCSSSAAAYIAPGCTPRCWRRNTSTTTSARIFTSSRWTCGDRARLPISTARRSRKEARRTMGRHVHADHRLLQGGSDGRFQGPWGQPLEVARMSLGSARDLLRPVHLGARPDYEKASNFQRFHLARHRGPRHRRRSKLGAGIGWAHDLTSHAAGLHAQRPTISGRPRRALRPLG